MPERILTLGTSNKNTKQTPLSGAPAAVIVAERVYIAPANTVYATPSAKLDGTDPGAPWDDLGVIADSKVSLALTKNIQYIETGLEKIKRGSYVAGKDCQISFGMQQYHPDILAKVSGVSSVVIASTGAKTQLGQEGIVERALLFIGTNPSDGSEFQHYSKRSGLAFSVEDNGAQRQIKVTGTCYPFVDPDASWGTEEGLLNVYYLP